MQPPIGRLTPVKAAIGDWLARFHGEFFEPDTPANVEWAAREATKAISWAPGRMVDQIESILSAWQRNDNENVPSTSAKFPALFVAVAPDYTESPGESGRPISDWTAIAFPQDPENRSFRVRTMSVDLRTQVVAVAPEQLSAMSLIGQLSLWAVNTPRVRATHVFNGFASQWAVVIMGGDRMAVQLPVGEHLSILALDLTIRANLPMFRGPGLDEENDGHNPPGYPVVQTIEAGHDMSLGPPTGVSPEEWAHYRSLVSAGRGAAQVVLHGLAEDAVRRP